MLKSLEELVQIIRERKKASPDKSYTYKLLNDIHNNYYLVYIIDNDYIDSQFIQENIGGKYYLTVKQFLDAYKKYALA